MGHFGNESFQAINCTGTDKQKQLNKTSVIKVNPKRKKPESVTRWSE